MQNSFSIFSEEYECHNTSINPLLCKFAFQMSHWMNHVINFYQVSYTRAQRKSWMKFGNWLRPENNIFIYL